MNAAELNAMYAAELNARNRAFWSVESAALERRLADPLLARMVLRDLRADQSQPVELQSTVEALAESAEAFMSEIVDRAECEGLRRRAKNGGSAKKGDELKAFIENKVAENAEISPAAIERALRSNVCAKGFEWLDDISKSQIILSSGKHIPLSGLKDRLSRAKKVSKATSR